MATPWAVVLALCCVPVACQQSFSQLGVSMQTQKGGQITWSVRSGRIEGVGGVHIEAVNKAAKTSLVADAQKMVVNLLVGTASKSALQGMDSIKSAQFDGPVKMVYVSPKPILDGSGKIVGEVITTTTATADSATFDGTQGIATLTGHVKIIQDDPSMWAEPAVMITEKASINLKRAPGAEDYDFKLESTTGPSRIEVVPKAKEAES